MFLTITKFDCLNNLIDAAELKVKMVIMFIYGQLSSKKDTNLKFHLNLQYCNYFFQNKTF